MSESYVFADLIDGEDGSDKCLLAFDAEDDSRSLQVLVTLDHDADKLVQDTRVVWRCVDDAEGWEAVGEATPSFIVKMLDEDPEVIGVLETCHEAWVAECDRTRGEP